MAKLSNSLTLQQYIEQRLIEVLGLSNIEAHLMVDEARLQLGQIRTNFDWSQPFTRSSLFARRFAWDLVLDRAADWFELCPEDMRKSFGGEL